MVRKCMIVMMQIMRLILKTYSITVRLTPMRQQVMSFFYLDTSRHAEENEFVVNNTNVTGGDNKGPSKEPCGTPQLIGR